MKNKKVVWCSAFTNVVPSDYEEWMEKMEEQGWHIDHIGQWSSIKMTFTKSSPRKYRYVYDMQVVPKKEYKTMYEQFGWELVGQMASAYIWRKEYTEARPEAFSDLESLEKRSRQFVKAVSVSFTIFFISLIAMAIAVGVFYNKMTFDDRVQILIYIALFSVFTAYLGYVMRKIYKNRRN